METKKIFSLQISEGRVLAIVIVIKRVKGICAEHEFGVRQIIVLYIRTATGPPQKDICPDELLRLG